MTRLTPIAGTSPQSPSASGRATSSCAWPHQLTILMTCRGRAHPIMRRYSKRNSYLEVGRPGREGGGVREAGAMR